MTDIRNDAAEELEREWRRVFVLNRLPLNESARQLIERYYHDPPITRGLYLFRLIACVAQEQGVDFKGGGEEVAWDLRALSELCADDAADFLAFYLREDGSESADYILTGDAKADVMRGVYAALPSHVRETMVGIAECGAVDDWYASDCRGGWDE